MPLPHSKARPPALMVRTCNQFAAGKTIFSCGVIKSEKKENITLHIYKKKTVDTEVKTNLSDFSTLKKKII